MVSYADEDPETLRERFAHWGYLYLKEYVSQEHCENLLQVMLRETAPYVSRDGSKIPHLSGEPFFETDPAGENRLRDTAPPGCSLA